MISLVTLPHYIQTPSADIINKIFELVKSDVISKNEILKVIICKVVIEGLNATSNSAVFFFHLGKWRYCLS